MRALTVQIFASIKIRICLFILLANAGTSATAQSSIPQRKPGLWEEIETTSLTTKPIPVRAVHCVGTGPDHSLDLEMRDLDTDVPCSRTSITRKRDMLVLEKRCKVGNSSTHAVATYRGNFDTAYEAAFLTRITPPYDGYSELSGTLKARWLGQCQPGQRPGDFVSDSGVKVNLIDLRKAPFSR